MQQIQFFAAREDLLSVLDAIERKGAVKYVRTGNALSPDFEMFERGADIRNLGQADAATGSICPSYLVTGRSMPLAVRVIDGTRGVKRYCMDQLINADTVALTPAGVWGEDVVLNGRVATVSQSSISQTLMKRFKGAFREHFTKVKAFYVGPNALDLLGAGKRLTISAQSPRDFDLTTSP